MLKPRLTEKLAVGWFVFHFIPIYNVACCYYTIEQEVFTITQTENGICKQLHLMD